MNASHYLKQHTRAAHLRTEQLAGGRYIMRGQIDASAYHQLLSANYQVWSFMDQQLSALTDVSSDANWTSWRMPEWTIIEQEFPENYLRTLTQNYPSNSFVNNTASAWGALYVLRGSTLGSQHILRALRVNSKLMDLAPFLFYQACASRAHEWPAFSVAMNEALSTPIELEHALAAANATFAVFSQQYQHLKINDLPSN